ncbi:MAG: M23 family metallopeptidase [Flavobacteriaceae bacterium]|nr:M23 family metallopeptidase [Flavobacteriaceae bacterium]
MSKSQKKTKKGRLKQRLLHKYRLVILNEETFEERLSFKLTKLNLFVLTGLSAILLIAGTTVLIAFTPLREYIPGYSSTQLKRQASELVVKTDSLQAVLNSNSLLLNSVRKVLTGDLEIAMINRDSIFNAIAKDPENIDFSPSSRDSLLRDLVATEEKYNVFENSRSKITKVLFPPAVGSISEGYDPKNKHYAVDIIVPDNAPVKSIADGTVIFSGWTPETGNTLIIDHGSGIISAYKHNKVLNKEIGDMVKSGEVVALAGSTGELSTGPHLHFELWMNGFPVNPLNFIDFK